MNTKNQPSILMPLPDGFAIGIGPNNQQYLVPQYMVPALDQAFAAYQSKADLGVLNARPGVSFSICGAVGTSIFYFLIILYLSFPKLEINHTSN
jgi:hypothetical protein